MIKLPLGATLRPRANANSLFHAMNNKLAVSARALAREFAIRNGGRGRRIFALAAAGARCALLPIVAAANRPALSPRNQNSRSA